MKAPVRPAAAFALVLVAALGAREAAAACTSLGFVSCSATVSVTAPLAFGNYDPASPTPRDNSTSIRVANRIVGVGLLVNVAYSISLSAGTGGTIASRQMSGPQTMTPLAYNLYTSSAYGTVWGSNGVSDSYAMPGTLFGTTVTREYTVYGRIPAGQFVAPGNYGSTITVTVDY